MADPTIGDISNGKRFVDMHGKDILYVPQWREWLVWDLDRWSKDTTLSIPRMAKKTSLALWHEAAAQNDTVLAAEAKRMQSVHGMEAMLKVASSDHRVIVQPEELDVNGWLLNTPTGTVDLRSGELISAGHRSDLITKMTKARFDPRRPKSPRWHRFLAEIFVTPDGARDQELIAYVQRLCGYCLTGSTEAQVFAILHGTGANGKGVFTNTLYNALGDYADFTAATTLLAKSFDAHPAAIASLRGRRLILSEETDAGRKLDESTVKNLTGSDPINARFMHQNPFTFIPTFKLMLATNHRPGISGTDEGIWRRIHLIPFLRTFSPDERDPDLEAKLRDEWEGILWWMVDGCLLWQAMEGLHPPKSVTDATNEYRLESDETRRFVRDTFDVGTGLYAQVSEVYRSYQRWAGAEGIDVDRRQTPMALGKALNNLGYLSAAKRIDGDPTKVRLGIRIRNHQSVTGVTGDY